MDSHNKLTVPNSAKQQQWLASCRFFHLICNYIFCKSFIISLEYIFIHISPRISPYNNVNTDLKLRLLVAIDAAVRRRTLQSGYQIDGSEHDCPKLRSDPE